MKSPRLIAFGLLALGATLAVACTGADAATESPTDIAIAELQAETRDLQGETKALTRENASLSRQIAALSGDAALSGCEVTDDHAGAATDDDADAAAHDDAPADVHAPASDDHAVAAAHDDAPAEADHGAGPPHWTYDGATDGPAAWGQLSAAFATCASGEQQSPINIASTTQIGLTDAALSYGVSDLTVINNGHTVQANVQPGNYLELDGQRYYLPQFHFHVPSEHEVSSQSFAMEMHFVHANAAGELAVVGVLFTGGAASAALAPIWSHLPAAAGDEVSVAAFQLPTLLPADHTAYRYSGSLTTPPCSEGVKWSVLRSALQVSAGQAQALTDLVGANNRPVQPVNTRDILEDATAGYPPATRRRGRDDSRPHERYGSCGFPSEPNWAWDLASSSSSPPSSV